MSIQKIRSSLDSDDLKVFDDIMNNINLANNVKHDIIGFDDVKNFIIRSKFNTKPYNGLICIENGNVANINCY